MLKATENRFYTHKHDVQLLSDLFILLSSIIVMVIKSSLFSISALKSCPFALLTLKIRIPHILEQVRMGA